MDFIEGLPLSDNANVILVIVDRLTKYAHFLPLKHPYTAATVAKLYLDNIVKLHGVPLSIISDRDKIFTSAFWRELIKAVGTKLHYSTAYHPQTDGQSERVNQCLEQYLRCAVQDHPKLWRRMLAMAEFWYNTSYHTAIGTTPFQALYQQEPNFGAFPNITVAETSLAHSDANDFQAHIDSLRTRLLQAQQRMKAYADKQRTERQFMVGEQVLLKLQPYAQQSVVNRPCPKLSYKFFGPYTVLDRIGAVAYKLQLPAEAKVHPVFHVSQLKPFVPKYTPVFSELPAIPDLAAAAVEPEDILERRMVRSGNTAATQIRVKWSGLDDAHATWEDYDLLKLKFPNAELWERDRSQGGDSVTPASSEDDAVDSETPSSGVDGSKTDQAGPSAATGEKSG
jgi:hypothetical protein